MKSKHSPSLALLVCLATLPLAATAVYAGGGGGGGGGGGDSDMASGISFRNRATVKNVQRNNTRYESRADYPVFRSQSMVGRYAGWQERLDAQRDIEDNAREFDVSTRDRTMRRKYTSRTTPNLYYESPNFISMRRDSSRYTGESMMDARTTTRNYGMIDGRPQRLTLGNFFRTGSDYRKVTNDRLIEKLRNQNTAPRVGDGTIRVLNDDQINNFTADSSGMTWVFNPGELGPREMGYTEVKLSRDELGPDYENNIFTR